MQNAKVWLIFCSGHHTLVLIATAQSKDDIRMSNNEKNLNKTNKSQ